MIADRNYSDQKISSNDLQKIRLKYGDNIKDIFELGPGQEWMFKTNKNNKSAFFLQMLLRAEIDIVPEQFRQRVNRVCERREALRFAYASKGLERPHCVELRKRDAEVIFKDMSSIPEDKLTQKLDSLCEADRHRGFDLENDSLLRITVLRLSGKNEYAFIISQPHINSDGTSIGLLIKDIFIDYVLGTDLQIPGQGENAYKCYAEYFNSLDIDAELAYWKEYLKDATEKIHLPGMENSSEMFDERVYLTVFSEEINDALKNAQKRYKTTVYNLLQTAWGITLNRITGNSDILFGAVTSGRDAAVMQSMSIPGGFVRVLPVRIRLRGTETFGEVARTVQEDFALSMKNNHCSLDRIREALGRKEPLFNHILNCHNFNGSESMDGGGMQLPGFKILGGNAYDNLSEDLAIYFRKMNGRMGIGIGYNGAVFAKETVQLYAETFQNVLKQVLLPEEDVPIEQLEKYDPELFEYTARMKQVENLKKTMLLKKHPVFEGIEWDDLMAVAPDTKLRTYLEEENVFAEDTIMTDLPILISNYVELTCKTNDGWTNPVKLCKAGDILSVAGLSDYPKAELAAVINSEEAMVLFISCDAVRKLNEKYPQVNMRLIRLLYKESIDYKKMWVNL